MIAGASGGIGSYLTRRYGLEGNELYITYNTSKNRYYKEY